MIWAEDDLNNSKMAKFCTHLGLKRQDFAKFFLTVKWTPADRVCWSFLALILGTSSQAPKILSDFGCLGVTSTKARIDQLAPFLVVFSYKNWKEWAVREIYYMDEGQKLTLLPKHCQSRQHGPMSGRCGYAWAAVLSFSPCPFSIFCWQPIDLKNHQQRPTTREIPAENGKSNESMERKHLTNPVRFQVIYLVLT